MAYVQAPDKFIFTANPCPVAVGGLGTSETVKFTVQDWEGGANLVELYLIAQSGTVSIDIGDVLSRLSYFSQNTSPIIATSLGTSRAVLIKFTNTAGSTVHYSAIHYLVNGGKQLGNDNTYFGSGYAVKWLTEIERPTYFIGKPLRLAFASDLSGANWSYPISVKVGLYSGTTVLPLINVTLPTQKGFHVIDVDLLEKIVQPTYPGEGGKYRLQVFTSAGAPITEQLTLKAGSLSTCDSVYLQWVNALGGLDSYSFKLISHSKAVSATTVRESERSLQPINLKYKPTFKTTDKAVTESYRIVAPGLTYSEAVGLRGVFESLEVIMLMPNGNYLPVIVSGDPVTVDKKTGLFDQELTITLPVKFTPSR